MQSSSRRLLDSQSVTVLDVACSGGCRHRSSEECTDVTHLVFPYRGVYVRHVGRIEAVADASQVLFFNEGESYHVSHPVEGGDASLSLAVSEPLLRELAPREQMAAGSAAVFRRQRMRINPRTQALAALLRHGLAHSVTEFLEAEMLALKLVRHAVGETSSHAGRSSHGRQKLVDRGKLVMSSDLGRRWSLAEIAGEVGVSPVYLTQVFQQVEGVPLYRYQLRLRLARALDLLDGCEDIARLGLDLGFSSHSHFSAAFKRTYGCTPAEFQRSMRPG